MIIVIGHVAARPGCLDDLLAISIEHVRRSRKEKGCISHAVHADCEDPQRLVFVEEWEDRGALEAHFALEASADFVRSARGLASGRPIIRVFEAGRVEI